MSNPTLPDWLPVGTERPAHAKIVATLGPASDSPEMIKRLVEAGVSIFRLNFSHGDLAEQTRRINTIRQAIPEFGRPVAILGDLQGPKIRVGMVPDVHEGGGIVVDTGALVEFRDGVEQAFVEDGVCVFGTGFDRILHDVEPGQRVLINDGAVRLLAIDLDRGKRLRCTVTFGGRVTTKKGINLPDSDLKFPAITDQDWKCVEWGVEHGVDYFALSFVRQADEIDELKDRLSKMCSVDRHYADAEVGLQIPVIAKIEKPQALRNLDAIIDSSDGIMVARGDLGVEMDAAQVPVVQKHIIARCADYGKPCIVATQMLESMITAGSPTRAEASDVANAVFDGADAVMLSGETAVGAHPGLVVETMRRIVQVAEARIDQAACAPKPAPHLEEFAYRSAALAQGAWHIAEQTDAAAVIVWSQRGGMARYLSRNDFRVPILACTSSPVAARRMCLLGGVTPLRFEPPASGTLADWTDQMEAFVLETGLARADDAVVMIAGKPLGSVTSQNTLAILRVGDELSGFRPR
ncbi:MAG: pyruvate kinase [Phycisphaeraceae bacterium]|nr:MAG: pyruvate kinase [Phycisphaeraceae bacterium]